MLLLHYYVYCTLLNMNIHIHVCVCYVCMYVCMDINTHTHTQISSGIYVATTLVSISTHVNYASKEQIFMVTILVQQYCDPIIGR